MAEGSSAADEFRAFIDAIRCASTTPGAKQTFAEDGSYTVKDADGNTLHHFAPEAVARFHRYKKSIAQFNAGIANNE